MMFISQAMAAEEAAKSGTFPPFDPTYFGSQLLWLTITFGVFYYIMANVVIPRLSGILEDRHDRISRDLDEAQRLSDEADAAEAAYEHELATAKKNANEIASEATEKAKAEANAAREKVEADLAEKLAEAEKRISEIKNKALGEVDTIAASTAETIVSELIGGKLTKTEINKAISAASK